MKLEFIPIKTRVVHPPKDDITDIIDSLEIKDGDIVFITSKIMGISEGRTVKADSIEKEELIKREAERYLPFVNTTGDFHVNLSVTQNVLIPAAGIDESNADGYFVMWPKNPDKSCREIREYLMKKHGVRRLGVVSTDSHTTPLRWGVTGITIGLAGIEPLRDIRGEADLFGRLMHVTKVDLIDPLTSMAVLLMGESDEGTPIVILRGYEGIPFSDEASMDDFKIMPEEDLYRPLIETIPKVKKS
ncbi:coenzyme F420-0:L-glutamate ligase [Candidatus Saccharibacteria bacterium]|nr:coenzyme F420-0:L-glutamate ligase [Candidatus Saccharibacteria bacterium]